MAQQGDARAQFLLGSLYAQGQGVPQDYSAAAQWFRRAAEQGHVGAQFNLGVRYHEGRGVPRDAIQAAEWFRRAAQQGFARAQYNLGVLYANGDGVPRDAQGFLVAASLDARYRTEATVTGFPDGESRVTVDLELEMETVIRVAGRVIDAEGQPISGAALYSSSSDWHALARTDVHGGFEISGVSASEYMLTAQAEGYNPASIKVQDLSTPAERETIEAHTPYPYIDGTYLHLSFGHLDGYSAIYYTYMWSLVIAKDLFTVFDSDTRVDPMHARKMCAALQHASSGAGPVLLRRETDVGHGARSVSRSVDLAADTLAFTAASTGLAWPPWNRG